MRTKIEKIKLTPKLKEHYDNLKVWLKAHPGIKYRKLIPFGFQISVDTIPKELVDEFIETSTFEK